MADLSSFTEYERDFQSLSASLNTRISALTTYTEGQDASAELRRVEADVGTARQRLTDMQMEVRAPGLPEATKKELNGKIRVYKESMDRLGDDLRRAKEKVQRNALMGAASRPMTFDKSMDARNQMQETTSKLNQGTAMLDDTHRRLEETVDVGSGIMGELQRNRETLGRIRGNVGVVSGTMDEARRILRSMAKREVRNKIAIAIFALVLIGIIVGVIVYVVQNKK